MLNVITCYKVVPEAQDIVIQDDKSLSFERAEWKIGEYDLNAIEAGMEVVEATEGKVIALSVGDKNLDNTKLKKAVLSRGPAELCLLMDEKLKDADANLTAHALAAAIQKIGEFDLVICGEGSSDLYAQQVGVQLGQLLNVPTLNGISKITPEGDKVIVERTLEQEVEILEVPLPAVISVTTDVNLPRIPTMRDIISAGKKPTVEWDLSDVELKTEGNKTELISTLASEQVERKKVILEGESEEIVHQLVQYLQKEVL